VPSNTATGAIAISSLEAAPGTIASGGIDGSMLSSESSSAGGFEDRRFNSLGSMMGGGSDPVARAAPGAGDRSLSSRITASSREDGGAFEGRSGMASGASLSVSVS
jgi:hypothetical protein